MKLHPLEAIAKRHFGVTDSLEETGYVLSDGTFLDLSGRHLASGYERKGDRFVPKKRQLDYLANQRSIDHRQLPHEIFEAVGTGEGSAAMLIFLRETGALRLMPGAGFLVASMPTFEAVSRVVKEWHHAFGNESLYVDIVGPGCGPDRASRCINPGDVRESQEFEEPATGAVMEFLESRFGGASMGGGARKSLYRVMVTYRGTGEIRGGDVGSLGEALETVRHFRSHGHDAEIYKWNADDERYLRIKSDPGASMGARAPRRRIPTAVQNMIAFAKERGLDLSVKRDSVPPVDIQLDEWVDPKHVKEVVDAIREADGEWPYDVPFPVVVSGGGRLMILDGTHRTAAAIYEDMPEIPVLVVDAEAFYGIQEEFDVSRFDYVHEIMPHLDALAYENNLKDKGAERARRRTVPVYKIMPGSLED